MSLSSPSSSALTASRASGEDGDKAARALTLFETLRSSVDADRLHLRTAAVATPAAAVPAPCPPAAGSAKQPAAKRRTPAEDAEKQLLRRQLAHAEELVRKLHDKNAALRSRVHQLEEEAATRARAKQSAKDEAAMQQDEHHSQRQVADLAAEVERLTAALAQQRPEVALPPQPPPASEQQSVTTAGGESHSLRLAALTSEVATLAHRLRVCEGQRDRLIEVQLASVLPVSEQQQQQRSSVSSSATRTALEETRIAKLVNGEVRKLFVALQRQLAEEAQLREAERARRNELYLLLERDAEARAEL